MESCRRACGGHGYSLLSGLPTAFTHYVQNVTWEGDNNVMLLQVGMHASPCSTLYIRDRKFACEERVVR